MTLPMERYNPWWVGESDPTFESWSGLPVKWVPDETMEVSLQPFSLNFLSGPRQVGKTTLIKLLIHEILKAADRRAVFYLSCDEVADFKELSEILDSYLRARSSWGVKRSYIFLDEVTFVEDWWRPVKARIDDGSFGRDVLTVTGSARLDLLQQRERFPGRRGRGKDVVLRPLSFRAYVKALSGLDTKTGGSLSRIRDEIEANSIFNDTLSSRFTNYLSTGGFPLAIRELSRDGRAGEDSRKALVDGLRGDWLRIGKSDSYMKEVIRYLVEARGTPVSWLSISKATSLGSPHTAQSYIDALMELMVVLRLDLLDPSGRALPRKNRKLHFTDPLVYNTLASYSGLQAEEASVVEATVAAHLARRHEVFYWRDGGEVDVIALEERRQVGVEVKWGFKKGVKPRHLSSYLSLDKRSVPLFLASLG